VDTEQAQTKKGGKPSTFCDELAEVICERLRNGESMRQICADPVMPGRSTVDGWQAKDPSFQAKCARAREDQADLMDDRIMSVADKTENSQIDPQAAKVVISALQWRASKLKPKVYGDKIDHSLSAPDGGPVQSVVRIELVPMVNVSRTDSTT
jgi:hypothetical protein